MSILRGEAVPLETVAAAGEFQTITSADARLVDGFAGALGIALASTPSKTQADDEGYFGRLNVVTSGQVPALVQGPCSAGDTLGLAASTADKAAWPSKGKYLKKSSSGQIVALEDVADPGVDGGGDPIIDPVMAWVKLGGGSGGSSEIDYAHITSTIDDGDVVMNGVQTVDGVDTIPGIRVLLTHQDVPEQNGLYEAKDGDWEFIGQREIVAVEGGDTLNLTWWMLTSADTYTKVGEDEVVIASVKADYLECTRADGTSINVAKPPRLRSNDTAARIVISEGYNLTKSAFVDGVYTGDCQKCTGTRSDNSETGTLFIEPAYLEGDKISILHVGDTGIEDDGGSPITYMDANVDSRHWLQKAEEA